MSRLILLGALAAAQSAPPAPPIPPVITTHSPPQLVDFIAGEASCGGAVQRPLVAERPMPGSDWGSSPNGSVELRFAIAPDGRPLGIEGPGGRLDAHDVVPAFAAWRFEPGPERADCRISFERVAGTIEDSDPATVARYAVLARPGTPGWNPTLASAAFGHFRPEGSNCRNPEPRRIVYPAFEKIDQAPATVSTSFLSYDVDAAGRPRNVRLLASDGNRELDRRSVAAIKASRYAPEARQGCNFHFYRNGPTPVPAPPAPGTTAFAESGGTCPDDQELAWKNLPPLVFPLEYRRRGIEGWAILRFDVAPWGAVGNVRVLAAQPALAFGEHAANIIRRGTKAESKTGRIGCVTRVHFRMEQDEAEPDEAISF